MALCSVPEVQAYALSQKLTTTDYENIINGKSKEIATKTRSTVDASGNDDLNLACVHASAAQVLRNMIINGELAASVKLGNDSQNNNIEPRILDHENQAGYYIRKYIAFQGFKIFYDRAGLGTINDEGTNSQLSSSSPYLRRI